MESDRNMREIIPITLYNGENDVSNEHMAFDHSWCIHCLRLQSDDNMRENSSNILTMEVGSIENVRIELVHKEHKDIQPDSLRVTH